MTFSAGNVVSAPISDPSVVRTSPIVWSRLCFLIDGLVNARKFDHSLSADWRSCSNYCYISMNLGLRSLPAEFARTEDVVLLDRRHCLGCQTQGCAGLREMQAVGS